MTIPPRKLNNADTGDDDHAGGNDWDDIADYLNNVDKTGPVKINTNTEFASGKLKLYNPGGTFKYAFTGAALAADRTLNFPLLTGTDTLAVLGLAQTLTNKTLDSTNTISSKTSLPAVVVNTDEANDYGDFDQSFKDNRVRIWNPADTFRYTIVAGAIADDRTLNLPVLTATDTVTTNDFAATLKNKSLNILDDGNDFTYADVSLFKRNRGGIIPTNGASTTADAFGILDSNATVAAGGAATGLDASGRTLSFDTGTSVNSNAGIRSDGLMVRRDFNFRLLFRFSIATVTSARFYAGVKSFTTAFPGSDTPLGASDSGVLFGFRSTDSAALKIFYNDGSAGVTVDDCSLTIAAGTVYDLEIVSDEANSKFKWRKRTNFGAWSAYTDLTTNIPAASTGLAVEQTVQNTTGTSRTYTLRLTEIYSDK